MKYSNLVKTLCNPLTLDLNKTNLSKLFSHIVKRIVELEKSDSWISIGDKLPPYGVPVLIVGNGVTQHVTYMLDGADDTPDWFEPYHFDHDDESRLWCHKVDYWMELPEPPK